MKKRNEILLRYITVVVSTISFGITFLSAGCSAKEETYYTAKGVILDVDDEGNVSWYTHDTIEPDIVDSPTGVGAVEIELPQIWLNGKLFRYSNQGFSDKLPDGFTKAGTIKHVDVRKLPEEDFVATGADLKVGMAVYTCEKYPHHLFVEYNENQYMNFYTLE